MDQEKIGKFILNLRKKHNLTQSQFADKLNITAQAVSKWENGRGLPDIELLKKISEEYKVDINELLEGEKRKKVWKIPVLLLTSFIILFIIGIGIFNFNNTKKDFEFTNITSDHESFNVKGIAAYNNDKQSIYISNIEYLEEDNEDYVKVTCSLYETLENIDKKISTCGSVENPEENSKTLSELLNQIEINVDNYESICENFEKNNLFLFINAIDKNNKMTNYKIPLKLACSCLK